MKELLLGCGHKKDKLFSVKSNLDWHNLTTVDINPEVNPDFIWDLNVTPWNIFKDNQYDEVHAYEVLEHLGRQGDFKSFFDHFSEIWRILKPNGLVYITTPTKDSAWLWGDPGHTRVILKESLAFLSQPMYDNVAVSPMTDYRFCYKADFDYAHIEEGTERNLFVLRAIKPSRYKKIVTAS